MAPDTQGRVVYSRRRKRDAPRCAKCGRRLLAYATKRSVTYYRSACSCEDSGRKKVLRFASGT